MKRLLILCAVCLPLVFAASQPCEAEYHKLEYAQNNVQKSADVYSEALYEYQTCSGWLDCISDYFRLRRADAELDRAREKLDDAQSAYRECLIGRG